MRFLFLAYRDKKNPAAVGGDSYLWGLARGVARLGNTATFVCSTFEGSRKRECVDGVEVLRMKGKQRLPFLFFKEYMSRWIGNVDVVVEEALGGERPPFLAALYVKESLITVWYQRHYKIFREQYRFPVWWFLSFLELFLARIYRNHTILTLSKGAKEQLMQLGFRDEKIKVVYVGGEEFFHKTTIERKRDDVIVCLGKLRRYKRFDHAILAFEQVRSQLKRPVRLVIAGKVSEIDKGYVEILRRLAEDLKLADSVNFRLNISDHEKRELLERAQLLIQPSPVEGFGIVVTEANRCGTPVVVSDGLPSDVVLNGQNGFVYPFGDIRALVNAVTKLFNDRALWRQMSKRAWELSQQFTWEDSTSEFLKIARDNSIPVKR